MTLARLGFTEAEKEVAQPPLRRASPTCSPRPGCCFLSHELLPGDFLPCLRLLTGAPGALHFRFLPLRSLSSVLHLQVA